jgi:hypothetical protein
MPGRRSKLGDGSTMRSGHIVLLATRLRRNTQLKSSPKRQRLIEISRRSKMDLHIQKVADRMDEKWGVDQGLKISLQRWYIERGRSHRSVVFCEQNDFEI